MRDEEAIPSIVGDLYEGAMDPIVWRRAMQGIADLVRGNETLLIHYEPTGALAPSAELVHPENGGAFAEYAAHWINKDLRIAPALRALPLEPQFELRLRCWREHLASEFYNEFLARHDFASFLCTWLEKDHRAVVALSVQGSRKRGPFEHGDAQRIAPVLPHVRRALRIRRRLQEVRARADSLTAALDRAPFGIILIDEAGGVKDVNAAAADLMRREPAISVRRDGKLRLDGRAGKLLQRRLAEATRSGTASGVIRLSRAGTPVSIVIAALAREPGVCGRHERGWLLLLTRGARERPLDPRLVAHDLDLSLREAEVVSLIASGHDLAAAAHALRISVQTVRTHLKAVYGKTGLHTQGQLIHRVLLGAASLREPTHGAAASIPRGQSDGGAIGARSAE
ncbi:MAG TPA: helix-turn-helix transcriptional regulator [Pseudomonadales bacterium]